MALSPCPTLTSACSCPAPTGEAPGSLAPRLFLGFDTEVPSDSNSLGVEPGLFGLTDLCGWNMTLFSDEGSLGKKGLGSLEFCKRL